MTTTTKPHANLEQAIIALRSEVENTKASLRALNKAQAACQLQIRAVRRGCMMRLCDVRSHPPSMTHGAETVLSGRYKPSAELVIDVATEVLQWARNHSIPHQDEPQGIPEHDHSENAI